MDQNIINQLSNHIDDYINERATKKVTGDPQTNTKIYYGTSGFRGQAASIEHIFFNVGLISGLKCLLSKANIGIMITASHNPIQDNGVKFVESNGEMLELQWEQIVEEFCNIHDRKSLVDYLQKLATDFNLDINNDNNSIGQVIIGMDTRPSSEALVDLIKKGLDAWSTKLVRYMDYGLVATPALHYIVGESNRRGLKEIPINTYYDKLTDGILNIFGDQKSTLCGRYDSSKLAVDCANGVGYETMKYLLANDNFKKVFPIELINIGGDGILNKNCGADYVKTVQSPPLGANDKDKRYASLDGDADRVVYFYLESNDSEETSFKLNLLDGDKILALFAMYLNELLLECDLYDRLSFGCVQTAYANGASTDYLTKGLKLKVDCTDTGVKNLHRESLKYDIAIYFEANGHGTILISQKAKDIIEANNYGEGKYAKFKNLFKIINNYIGDAISDIFVVETILKHYKWGIEDWFKIYDDRPNSLMKIEVPDRNKIKTTNAGRTCLEPVGLQDVIDSKIGEFGTNARCFIRPSGTENVVRVYAEANGQDVSNKLANHVCELVKNYCN